MTIDKFFAEARRLNCRMVSDDPAEVRATLDAKECRRPVLNGSMLKATPELTPTGEAMNNPARGVAQPGSALAS